MCINNLSDRLKDRVKEWLGINSSRLDYMQVELKRLKAEVEQIKEDRELEAVHAFIKTAKAYYRQEQVVDNDLAQENNERRT